MTKPELHIYTALTVPTLCLTTKAAAYILTPDYGINFDTSSVIRPSLNANSGSTIGWFRTMIQLDKVDPMKWPELSQEWGTLSLGSVDLTLWTVVFSPSGLSSEAGCVAATLSSNMDLCLWAPVKNTLKGEWKNMMDVTPILMEHLLSSEMQNLENKTPQVLKAQITSIAWSHQCHFGYAPSPIINGSLLVAGSRAGSLVMIRFLPETQSIQIINIMDVCGAWVTHISITPWKTTEQGQCQSLLAYAAADGSIGIIKLTQQLIRKVPSSQLFESLGYEIGLVTEQLPSLICEPSHSGITGLQWIKSPSHDPILVHCTPGLVHIHYPTTLPLPSGTSMLNWKMQTFRLKTCRTSTMSSALHPPSGIIYLSPYDQLIIALSDGSINVLRGLDCGNPRLTDDDQQPSTEGSGGQDQLTSSMLSTNARSIFVRIEQEVDKHDMNKITGMTGYDVSDGVFVWSYEVHRPGDFSYKHDAKQKSVLVVANLWDHEIAKDVLLRDLESAIGQGNAMSGRAPLDILRPILLSMRDGKKLDVMHEKVLKLLGRGIADSDYAMMHGNSQLSQSRWKGKGRADAPIDYEMNVKESFGKSVSSHLFSWDAAMIWRIKLGLADYVWKLSDSPEKKAACGVIAQGLLDAITHHIFGTLVRHVLIVSPFLDPYDVPFARRLSVIVQTLLAGVRSPDLVTDAQRLLESVEMAIEEGADKETCPACQVEVPLADVRGAVCANGHVWTRCSVTALILSTAFVRTCIGCKRKAFLPPSATRLISHDGVQHLPPLARGWMVQELLETVRRCLYCGNGFVCIV
ncbi:hypothetical protein APHAL10511_004019 [Amanita phalloides]|nr:hypothetical protein APHAL10511_004019 [Amanita phalloides]